MTCLGRWAEAWQYASFWCVESILAGQDDSGGAPLHPVLSCSYIDFELKGVLANIGMVLYNTTTNISGVVTAVSGTTVTAAGVTWTTGDAFRIVLIDGIQKAAIENALNLVAPDVNAALGSVGACDCNFASWASDLLAKINIIEAGLFHTCPCSAPEISDDFRRSLMDWVNTQFDAIRTGKLELCDGHTGSDFPSVGWAEQSVTEFSASAIIVNSMRRLGL